MTQGAGTHATASICLVAAILCGLSMGVATARAGVDDDACEACHDVTTSHGAPPSDVAVAHAKVGCVDCHEDLRDFDAEAGDDHDTPLDPANCNGCHEAIEVEVAASEHAGECAQCHSAHDIGVPPRGEEVRGAHAHFGRADACAECHESSVEEWLGGVHALGGDTGRPAADCVDCHGAHDVVVAGNRGSRVHPLNIPDTCESCHRPAPSAASRSAPLPGGADAPGYETSVHGRALRESGLVVTATCASCHGSHTIRRADDPAAPTSRRKIPETCGKCHVGILDGYLEGVHGAAFEKGVEDVPVCNDCHLEHAVDDPRGAASSVSAGRVARTCARCHADDTLTNRYALKATAWASWGRSYHGIASGYGDTRVANCASCHEHHDIFASNDPRSSVHAANLEKTCGHCHIGATATFAHIPVHSLVDRESNFASWIVRRVYGVAVVGLIGMFVVLVLVDLFGRLRLRIGWGPPETAHVDPEEWADEDSLVAPNESFERMSAHARLQHGLLVASFLLLVATGLPVFLHDSEWLHALFGVEGAYRLRSKLHRAGAVVLIALCTWHLGLLLLVPAARRAFAEMMIRRRDVTDFVKDLAFSLGMVARRPPIGRYGLVEKIEYAAVLWGNVVMIASGLVLWKPAWFLDWAPSWTFDVCRIVHGFEATLAFLAIIVWHMYHVHMKPGVFPMSPAWITGRISRRELRQHHPDEYLKILAERRRAAQAAENEQDSQGG